MVICEITLIEHIKKYVLLVKEFNFTQQFDKKRKIILLKIIDPHKNV